MVKVLLCDFRKGWFFRAISQVEHFFKIITGHLQIPFPCTN